MTIEFASRLSMDSPEWYTPTMFAESARIVMGGIDLDPASHEEANERLKISRIFTKEDNGLTQPWEGRIFVNPPGGLVNEFWCKAQAEFHAGRASQVMWIGYSLEQLQTLQNSLSKFTPLDYPICVTARRIAFVENRAKREQRIAKLIAQGKKPNEKSSPTHSNYITYLGPNLREFHKEFSQYGRVNGIR